MNSPIQALLIGLKTTLSNVRTNKQTFLISVMTIAISIGILGIFLILFINLNGFLTSWNQQINLVVYLDDDITPSQKTFLEDLFKANTSVQSVEEVTKERAWQEFKLDRSKGEELDLDLGFNPLPNSYKIRFKVSDDRSVHISNLADEVKGKSGVESVEYGEEWISRFDKFMTIFRVFLLGVGVLLSLGLILIISNTIRLSIYSRQDEIELMLLIGATPRFVKIPFLLEGILQGLSGALLSLGFMGIMYANLKSELQPSIDSIARGMDFQFIPQPFLLVLIGISVLIGFVASYISIYQFMQILNKR